MHILDYDARQKSLNSLLRLLVESEITRLNVWGNPTNDLRRGPDHVLAAERTFTEVRYQGRMISIVKLNHTTGLLEPSCAHGLESRSRRCCAHGRAIQEPSSCSGSGSTSPPEPLRCLPSSGSSSFSPGRPNIAHDYLRAEGNVHGPGYSVFLILHTKHVLYWASIPPVLAIIYFGPNYANDPSVLQYAHGVLVQYPVDLTFFFVPQVVQALRNDALGEVFQYESRHVLIIQTSVGYVERFIFETAKISQLFCHQIIWNMKANCYKDDGGKIVSMDITPQALIQTPFCRRTL